MAIVHKAGDVINGFRIVKDKLGSGGFTMFYQAEKDGRDVFLKQYKAPAVTVDWFNAYLNYEKKIKRYIESGPVRKNTYEIIDIFSWNKTIYQAMEFVPNGKDLSNFLDENGDDSVRSCRSWENRVIFAKLLMDCIKKLHESKIVHCDLKPENLVLIEDSSIKTHYRLRVADLDWSFIDGDTPPWAKEMGYMGTDGYRSPEHIRRQRPTFASDVFTCGIILYEILCNDSPFPVDNYDKLVLSYKPSEPVLLSNYPDESNDVICQTLKRCLNPDPKKRPTAAEVHAILLGDKTAKEPSDGDKTGGGAIRPGEKPKVTKASVALTPDTPSEPEVSEAPRKTPIQLVGSISNINASIDTKIGKPTLRNLCGEEGNYAETVQYTLECEGDSWYIAPNPDATNDTMLNGKRIVKKTLLKSGDQIGVGRESKGVVKALVTVQF